MPAIEKEKTVASFLQDKQSSHDKSVGASAARLLLALRDDFSQGEEHDLTQAEHDFLNSGTLAKVDVVKKGLPLEWDTTYPNLTGIFAFIRAMLTHPRFNLQDNLQDYQKVCHNINRLAEMKKDHWSIKAYHEDGVAKTLQPSMGEVINLVSHGVLNNEAFEVTPEGADKDRQDRLTALFDLFLNPPDLCSTGISTEFLFVVDGYKGIRIIELLSGFLKELTLLFVKGELLKEYQPNSKALYDLVLDGVGFGGDRYEQWLQSRKSAIEAYLQTKCSELKLDTETCHQAIDVLIQALDYLEVPTDVNPSVVTAMKYVFHGYKGEGENNSPVVQEALAKVRAVLPSLESLSAVSDFGVVDFYRGIQLLQECDRFKTKYHLMNGVEIGKTQTSATRLTTLLTIYFERATQSMLSSEQLRLPEEINEAVECFHGDMRQYAFGHLVDFVKNFFALLANQETLLMELKLFEKMDAYREQLLLTDVQIIEWAEKNINPASGELSITPYEINQFILNALWRNPEDWSVVFRELLSVVLDWLHDDSVRDGLKENIKASYMQWRLLGGLSLVLFMTRVGAPDIIRNNYLKLWSDYLYERFNEICCVQRRFSFNVLCENVSEMANEFLRGLKKFDLTYDRLVRFFSKESKLNLNSAERELILNVLLDVDVLTRNTDQLDAVCARFSTLLSVFSEDLGERVRVLDCLYQELDASMLPYKENLISNHHFSCLSFAEKERFLLKLSEPTTFKHLFLRRAHFDPSSPHYAILTEKLDALVKAGAADETDKHDLEWTFDVLFFNEDAQIEWLRLHSATLKDHYQYGHGILEFMNNKSTRVKQFFYECVIRDNLRELRLGVFDLKSLLECFGDFRATMEEDVFETLKKPNDKTVRCWEIGGLYEDLSEPNKERLMRLWVNGELKEKGNIDDRDIVLVLMVLEKAKKSWQEAALFLEKYSPKLLNAVIFYVFQRKDASLESAFAVEFLSLYFNALFGHFWNKRVSADEITINALFLLYFHFKDTFYLSDEIVNPFIRSHSSDEGKALRISESEAACFVMHALHIPPNAWSPDFKAAFKIIVDALKQNLANGKASELRAPYCLPEFVYNLSALLVFASMDVPMDLKPALLLDVGSKSKGSYSCIDNLFYASYLFNVFHAVSDVNLKEKYESFFKAFFHLLEDELAFHIGSEWDVLSLLELKWLSSSQRDLVLGIALQKAERGELRIDDNTPVGSYFRGKSVSKLLNSDQNRLVEQFLKVISGHAFRDDSISENSYGREIYFHSKSICFFTQKAAEKPEPKGQNKTICLSRI